jgi:hypothetical protein
VAEADVRQPVQQQHGEPLARRAARGDERAVEQQPRPLRALDARLFRCEAEQRSDAR